MHQGLPANTLYFWSPKTAGPIKEDLYSCALVKACQAAPDRILSLRRKMIVTSAKSSSEKVEHEATGFGRTCPQDTSRHTLPVVPA
ncbi:hypothetical protein [Phocaeicola dorei]|uniref:Uncharacterized protein n=1 Tax=Phocaeicola dorei TaxID=357276 RepID=A0A4Q5HKZ4_9BACT|nr:hypothetical protein [Phocaeicola dorei]KAA5390446.1 hypothetical protein F2Y56_20235 [Phocaeicola dorei]KAA5393075.1 hypothetical protein F2Y58_20795 [Phocaeicola dorei]OUN79463.1 hypothetical protein B5G04_15165 [Bacteroides sp. An51A]RYT87767.1 hypothetical protein EAJ02_20600 [Phocaeicola dorei]